MIPWNWPIDLAKGITFPVLFGLMVYYDTWTVGAWVYLALHGTYGVLWVLKSWSFPDRNWEAPKPAWLIAATFGALMLYWSGGIILIASGAEPPGWLLMACISANVFGTFLVFGSDAQKYFVLRARRGLITDGFFARTRNPNYLGEILIYASFCALSMHWFPWLVCGSMWVGFFLPNMRRKDASMARYPEWDWYVRRTGLLLPALAQPAEDRPVVTA